MSSATSSRSSSILSTSSLSKFKPSKATDAKKKFACTYPACGKAFSRSEHLHRHALNHKDGNNTCLRCSAHFRRRDLLDRHMARHKEKDDEAGGEGLGILATRKRLWRDTDGNIVNARRPSCTQEGAKRRQLTRADRKSSILFIKTEDEKLSKGQSVLSGLPSPSAVSLARNGSASSTIIVDTGARLLFGNGDEEEDRKSEIDDSWLEMSALPSPPTSYSESASLHSPTHSLADLDALYDDESEISSAWPPLPLHNGLPPSSSSHHSSISTEGSGSSGYPSTPSWDSDLGIAGTGTSGGLSGRQPFQTFMGAMAELPYDDIFKPEAGLYDWQAWNSQVLMSKCREEKFDPFLGDSSQDEKRRDGGKGWALPGNIGEGSPLSFRRPFGLGTC